MRNLRLAGIRKVLTGGFSWLWNEISSLLKNAPETLGPYLLEPPPRVGPEGAIYLAFAVLLAGVACSVRVIFTIYIGVNHSLAVPLMKSYGKDPQATSAWDNLHSKYIF